MNKAASKASNLQPTLLTIFGITGDLSKQRLLPALYNLEKASALPKDFYVVGVTRRSLSKQQIRQAIKSTVDEPSNGVLLRLMKRIHIAHIHITDNSEYPKLRQFMDNLEQQYGVCFNRLFYLAIPPSLFASVVSHLGAGELHKGCLKHHSRESRVLIEKPFGYDTASAKELIKRIDKYFKENQVYRIDHYMAKETVQNIIQFRFANPLIDAVWNHKFVDHVQITVAEDSGIGFRKDFYEQTGALRDVLQNHIMQLVAVAAMERPANMSAAAIQSARLKVLQSLVAPSPNQVSKLAVRGQYVAGKVNSHSVKGYRQEVGNAKSFVETYAAIKYEINTPRWRGVPFVLRTGKRLSQKVTDVTLVFKDRQRHKRPANTITIRVAPNEGIALDLLVKKPGLTNDTEQAQMDFCYSRSFDGDHLGDYERLLLSAVAGDRTLFPTGAEVMASWRAVEPVLSAWSKSGAGLTTYRAGSWGPSAAEQLAARFGCDWLAHKLNICPVHVQH